MDASQYMFDNGVPVDRIPVNSDPIIIAGIQKLSGQSNVPTPVLVSFITGEVITGYKKKEYERLVTLWRSSNDAGVPDVGNHAVGTAEAVASTD